MAYYDSFKAKWALQTGTTAQKLAAVNALLVTGPATPAIVTPSQILNTIVFADLAALTQLQVSQLSCLLSGGSVDASPNTTIRLGIQALFAGKAATLSALAALAAKYDTPQIPFYLSNGYTRPFDMGDVTAAGVS